MAYLYNTLYMYDILVYILLSPHVIKDKTDHKDNDNNTIIFVRIYSPGINKGRQRRKVNNECG